jgi:KipI family sensor histidine kinase inhibitor
MASDGAEARSAAGPQLTPYGDGALLVVLGEEISPQMSRRVHGLARTVSEQTAAENGWGVPVPGHASLLVPYDPLVLTQTQAKAHLRSLVARAGVNGSANDRDGDAAPLARTRVLDVPVRYGGEDGPDLAVVAAMLGLEEAEIVSLHASVTYEVLLLGFVPGFAYLGMLPGRLEVPRRKTPRTHVPSGSVAIAGRQTAVYPAATPGGWHLIGRTDVALWDAANDPPALLRPGQRVAFRPVAK